MESQQAPSSATGVDDKQVVEVNNDDPTAKLQAMVTAEQVLSANVARRRRTLSKRNQANRAREQTPCRDTKNTSSEEEDAAISEQQRPKTPERRRRKSRSSIEKTESFKLAAENRPEIVADEKKQQQQQQQLAQQQQEPLPQQEPPQQQITVTEEKRKNSLVEATQAEVLSLIDKAKKSFSKERGLRRFTPQRRDENKSAASRSQSVPSQFTEAEIIDRLTKANLLDKVASQDKRENTQPPETTPKTSTEIQTPIKHRKSNSVSVKARRPRITSPKVIEILDPSTKKVVRKITKIPPQKPIPLWDFLRVLRTLSLREIARTFRLFKSQHRCECANISKLRNRCFSNAMLIFIFCGLGGILFKYVEGSFENFYKCGVKRVKRDFIDVLWYRSHNLREDEWKSLARNRLRVFEEELHVAHEAGMTTYSGRKSWSFLNGIIYCLTVVTTIGYGHIYPKTVTGQALTVVYAIIGIPLFLIALTDFGKLFTRSIKFLWSFVRRLYYTGSCKSVRKTAHVADLIQGAQAVYEFATLRRPSLFAANAEDDPENPKPPESSTIGTDEPTTPALSQFEIDDEFNLPISVAIFILVLYILLGAVMYTLFEDDWDFFASFYFVFISMSTIGFGDYVPSNHACMVASIFYLVFGLALMSMCINVVQVKLSDTFKDASAKLGATMGLEVNEDGSATDAPVKTEEVPSIEVVSDDAVEKEGTKKSNLKTSSSSKDNDTREDVEEKESKEEEF